MHILNYISVVFSLSLSSVFMITSFCGLISIGQPTSKIQGFIISLLAMAVSLPVAELSAVYNGGSASGDEDDAQLSVLADAIKKMDGLIGDFRYKCLRY